jgi:hypothetical protein
VAILPVPSGNGSGCLLGTEFQLCKTKSKLEMEDGDGYSQHKWAVTELHALNGEGGKSRTMCILPQLFKSSICVDSGDLALEGTEPPPQVDKLPA